MVVDDVGETGKDLGRVCPIKQDKAIEPHPPDAQMMSMKCAMRNVRWT